MIDFAKFAFLMLPLAVAIYCGAKENAKVGRAQ